MLEKKRKLQFYCQVTGQARKWLYDTTIGLHYPGSCFLHFLWENCLMTSQQD